MKRKQALIEVFLGLILFFGYVWFVLPLKEILLDILVICISACLLIYGHISNKDSFKQVFSLKNFVPSMLILLYASIPIAILLFFLWSLISPVDFLFFKKGSLLKNIFVYPLWAFAQQYIFIILLFRRFVTIFNGKKYLAVFSYALIFSFAHLPNPPLMICCFAGAILWGFVYLKYQDLFSICLTHAFFGIFCGYILLIPAQIGPNAPSERWTNNLYFLGVFSISEKNLDWYHPPVQVDVSSQKSIDINGWAAARNLKVKTVIVTFNGKEYISDFGSERKSVAVDYGEYARKHNISIEKFLYSGFNVSIPLKNLKQGQYELGFKIITNNQIYHFLSLQHTVKNRTVLIDFKNPKRH